MFVKGKSDFGRGRCKECNRIYKRVQKNQKFCTPKCSRRHRSAGGFSFERQAKLIEKQVKEEFSRQRSQLLADVVEQIRAGIDPTETARAALQTALSLLKVS